jgi:hypothetical protein
LNARDCLNDAGGEYRHRIAVVIRWDEKAGLRRDAIRSQVIDALEAQEIKETGLLIPSVHDSHTDNRPFFGVNCRRMKTLLLPLLLAVFAMSTIAQSKGNSSKPAGSIEGNNTYINPILELRVSLPGKWHLMPPTKYAASAPNAESPSDSQCRGPLCGKPEIDEALETDSLPAQSLFLTGYKKRYPFRRFAEAMLQGSLAGSDWVPVGSMSQVQVAGHEAYRLLVHDPSKPGKKGFGFMFESNGYMCLLVGTDLTPSQNLLPAINGMRSDKSKP